MLSKKTILEQTPPNIQKTQGIFIVFEGTEGAGKTTQINLLMAALDKYAIEYVSAREPGGTEAGQDIRNVLLNREYSPTLDDTTQALLFAASYRDRLQRNILPNIEKGKWVISDRTNISTFVYQRNSEHCKDLLQINDKLKVPDLVFILTTNYETVQKRITGRAGNNFRDYATEAQHNFLLEGYGQYIEYNPNAIVLDCNKTPEEIHQEVLHVIFHQSKHHFGVKPCLVSNP